MEPTRTDSSTHPNDPHPGTAATESAHALVARAPSCEPPLGVRAGLRRPRAARSAHSGRPPARRAAGASSPADDRRRATACAEHAVRLALEILDRRRSPSRIGAILAPEVVDLLRSVAAAPIHPARRLGAATVLRVHTADSADPAMLELFGTYRRGERVFAFAGRMHERRTATGTPTWCVTSLRVS